MENKMNRRSFFAAVAKVIGIAAIAPTTFNALMSSQASAQEKRRGESAKTPMVDTNDSVAKAVQYVEDFKKAPAAKGNKCSTCGFYNKKEGSGDSEVGTCTIFAGKYVKANGYCNSWNKKA